MASCSLGLPVARAGQRHESTAVTEETVPPCPPFFVTKFSLPCHSLPHAGEGPSPRSRVSAGSADRRRAGSAARGQTRKRSPASACAPAGGPTHTAAHRGSWHFAATTDHPPSPHFQEQPAHGPAQRRLGLRCPPPRCGQPLQSAGREEPCPRLSGAGGEQLGPGAVSPRGSVDQRSCQRHPRRGRPPAGALASKSLSPAGAPRSFFLPPSPRMHHGQPCAPSLGSPPAGGLSLSLPFLLCPRLPAACPQPCTRGPGKGHQAAKQGSRKQEQSIFLKTKP